MFFLAVCVAKEKRSLLVLPMSSKDFLIVNFSLAFDLIEFGAGPSSRNIFLIRSSSESRKSLNFVSATVGMSSSGSKATSMIGKTSFDLVIGTSRVLDGVMLTPGFDRVDNLSCDEDRANEIDSGTKLPFAKIGPW